MNSKSCTEVLELLKYIPIKDYLKIPKETISILKQNEDESYSFKFDKTKDISEQKISRETWIIILKIYLEYILIEEEKNKVNEILKMNEQKRSLKYSIEDLFKKDNDIVDKSKQLCLINENKWYKKIFNFLKKFFINSKKT